MTFELEPFLPALAAVTEWLAIPSILAVLAGLATGWAFVWWRAQHTQIRAREHARQLLELAEKEAEIAKQTRLSEANIEIERRRAELDRETTRRELEIDAKVREIHAHQESLGDLDHELAHREEKLTREQAAIKRGRDSVRTMSRDLRRTMQNLTSMDLEEVRESLKAEVRNECQDELRSIRRDYLERSEAEYSDEARRILVAAMQRLTTQSNNDLTATIVQLPNDDMKGRIIGREGRNIKCFEAATGTTLLIDESPQMVLISSFDPIRREIARSALEHLIADGRIHPATIEDFVAQAQSEVDRVVQDAGDAAISKLNLSAVHPEVITLLGKLKFRFSYTQNVLDHSVEVALLCSMLASEMQLDPVLAKRAGLFHDIGKSVDGEYEGSHARIGGEFLKRRGEESLVVNAVAAHHQEVPAESVYAGIVMLADTISAIRPGARAESLTSYIQRLDRLEKLACGMDGVQSAYAIQAGREIRVIAKPDEIDDEGARKLAREIRRKIEDELQYPSTIKVTVIRERRYTETAT